MVRKRYEAQLANSCNRSSSFILGFKLRDNLILSSLDFAKGTTAKPEKCFTLERATYAIPKLFSFVPKSTTTFSMV
jgi:hypothetical protein